MLAVGTQDGFVRMIEAASGEVRLEVQAHSRAVSCVALSPNGHLLASSSDEASAKVRLAEGARVLDCCTGCA
ncbi:hypothetical protein T484DRAFT_3474757 [Baffinella frigidus]|nr:hypothetical protein T484DRAFT_3474757 [Cryptophyta sp. CCMP2293]